MRTIWRNRRGTGRRGGLATAASIGLIGAVAVAGLSSAAESANEAGGTPLARPSPLAAGDETITEPRRITGRFDGGGKRYIGGGDLGGSGPGEGPKPLFQLASGASLSNVVINAPAADGVHCEGSCQLRNVVWEDVGEDAATFRGTNATVVVEGGSAAKANDKVFQDNRLAGGSLTIRDFTVTDFGKLYRSCGNCEGQSGRKVTVANIKVTAPAKVIVAVNQNLGDVATISNVTITGPGAAKVAICEIYNGNSTGGEPQKISSKPDGKSCTGTGVKQ